MNIWFWLQPSVFMGLEGEMIFGSRRSIEPLSVTTKAKVKEDMGVIGP